MCGRGGGIYFGLYISLLCGATVYVSMLLVIILLVLLLSFVLYFIPRCENENYLVFIFRPNLCLLASVYLFSSRSNSISDSIFIELNLHVKTDSR